MWVTVTVRPDCVAVVIEDDGPGISGIEYEAVTGQTVTLLGHGQGIGLDIVYWIVRHSGGRASITDRSPCGSTILLELFRVDE